MSTPTSAATERATDLAEYMGVYQLSDGGEIMLGGMVNADQLVCFDRTDGRVAALAPAGADRFTYGPGLFVAEPVEAQITFTRNGQGAISGLVRQRGEREAERARRVRLEQEDLHFHNGDVALAATLIRPAGSGPHPAIVLIHGSGPQGRAQMRPVADFFAHHGVAALVYDKRGVGESTGDWQRSSFDDLAADALAGLQMLRERSDIRPDRVGLWGRSQGGWLGPLAASRCADAAFVISVVGPATSVFQQDLDRVEHQMRADGRSEGAIAAALDYVHLQIAAARGGASWPQLQAAAERAREAEWAAYVSLPDAETDLDWLRANDYDPLHVLQALACPILALFGERDMVVPVATNLALMQQLLSRNPDHTIVVMPRANHSSLVAETGGPDEMARLSRFVPEYFTIMADWLRAHVGAA